MLFHSYFPNGCEVDITIKEDFPEDKLVEFIDAFAEVKLPRYLINNAYVAVLGRNRTLFRCVFPVHYRVRSAVTQNFH